MTAKVVTALPDRQNAAVGYMPYVVSVKGKETNLIKAFRVQNQDTGEVTVRIDADHVDDKPTVAVSTLDALARTIVPSARIAKSVSGKFRSVRTYSI